MPVLLKKDYRHTTSVTGLLDELGWLPLFERRVLTLVDVHFSVRQLSCLQNDRITDRTIT